MGKRYGYGRVSTKGQAANGNSLEDQRRKLEDASCDEIIMETYTGTKTDRPKFTKLLSKLQRGDTLIVCKVDRFARTLREGLEVVEELMDRGVAVHVLNLGLLEDTPNGRLIFRIWLAFADYERDVIIERTQTGKAIARERDDYKEGRPRREPPREFFELLKSDVSVAEACAKLEIHKTQWYRWKNEVSCRA
jgi:DNA invertase Pin-like site-specific DNA recombinase